MASDRTITIRILNDASDYEPSAKADSQDKNRYDSKSKSQSRSAFYFTSYISAQVTASVKAVAEAGYSRYISLTENYQAEVAKQNAVSHISRFGNVAGSALGGAMFGFKAGGIVGAVFGAAIGFVAGGVRNETSARTTLAEQEKAIHEEAYSIYFNTARAGMINYSRGTEN